MENGTARKLFGDPRSVTEEFFKSHRCSILKAPSGVPPRSSRAVQPGENPGLRRARESRGRSHEGLDVGTERLETRNRTFGFRDETSGLPKGNLQSGRVGKEPERLNIARIRIRGYSSAGRAPALQAGGQRFDPVYLHHGRSPFRRARGKLETAGSVPARQMSPKLRTACAARPAVKKKAGEKLDRAGQSTRRSRKVQELMRGFSSRGSGPGNRKAKARRKTLCVRLLWLKKHRIASKPENMGL